MKTVKDLLLAMINATLILVALCLFLLWQLSRTGERVVASFAESLQIVEPLEVKVEALRTEVSNLRADLAGISLDSSALTTQTTQRLQSRADALQGELGDINTNLEALANTPDRLLQQALDDVAARVSLHIGTFVSCHAPENVPDASTPNS